MGYAWSRSRVAFLAAGLVLSSHVAWARPITVGSISTEPGAEVKKFVPLAAYLARQLHPDGIDQGKVVVAKSIPEMASLLREGKVDLYIDSPFPSMAVARLAGSKFLLRRWKKGIAEYHAVIFTHKDSGVDRVEDLRGRTIVFEEPFSSSGYFVPVAILRQHGLRLVAKKDHSDPVGPGEVGYVFSYADENTMLWVLRRAASAGAMDDQSYLKEGRGDLSHLKVIHTSFPIPRHILSYRADLPARLVARIKNVLVAMDQSEEGKKALQDFEKTTKFDELSEESLAPLLKLERWVQEELGAR